MSVIRSQCKDNVEFIQALRDEFAGKAMQAWLSTFMESPHPAASGKCDILATRAYEVADAMLKARKE
jgi:hypothetical protein